MNKKQRIEMIIEAVKASRKSYRVLNELNGMPQHVRIDGFGDVYPATGTWLGLDKKWHRKDSDGFIDAILGGIRSKPILSSSIENRVQDLEEFVSHLEDEISRLKSNVFQLG